MMQKIQGSMRIVLVPEGDLPLVDKVKHYWAQSLELAASLNGRVKVQYVWVRKTSDGYSMAPTVNQKGMAFKPFNDYMPLADPDMWVVPFPLFMRLSSLHLEYADFERTVDYSKLWRSTPIGRDVMLWTFWLHKQGVKHLEYLA